MRIGLLNERIMLLKTSVEVDDIGNHKIKWSKYYECYATVSAE
ncbi:head-tail adaptor protein, partial [Bifidobacteriaceae bacterium NR016]